MMLRPLLLELSKSFDNNFYYGNVSKIFVINLHSPYHYSQISINK